MTKKTKAFLRGYGSVLNLKPFVLHAGGASIKLPHLVKFRSKKRSARVRASLRSDWEAVGGDLFKAVLEIPGLEIPGIEIRGIEMAKKTKKGSVEEHAT